MSSDSKSNVVKIKKSNNFISFMVFLLLIIGITIVAFAVYLKSQGYDFSSLKIKDAITFINNKQKDKNSAALKISLSETGSFDCIMYKSYIVVLSKDSIKWYNKDGKLAFKSTHNLTSPVLRSSNKYMAVADSSGRDLLFYKDKTLLWSKKLENQIINTDVSDDGYCTVVTQSKDYKSAVQVIDINGVEKEFKKLYAEDIAWGAKALHDGQDVLINKLVTDSVKTGTELEFYNIYKEKPFATLKTAGDLLSIILSHGENEIAVGQKMLIYMDKQGKEVWRKSANEIYCIAPNSKEYVIIAGKFTDASKDAKQLVLVLNNKGEEIYSFKQPENVIGMHLYDNRLALRTQRSIYLYTLKGKKIGQYDALNDIKDVYLTGDNEAVVVSGGSVSIVKITG